jgi:hypothetical protein
MSTLTPETVSAGCGLIEAALQAASLDGVIRAIDDTGRTMTIDLALPTLPSATQRRLLLVAARTLAPKARWSSERLEPPGPFANAASLPQSLCVPILRRRRTTIWWSLRHVQHIILAGDALPTLLGMLPALMTIQERKAASIALYDPARILGTQARAFTAAPDALTQARTRTLRDAWRGQPAELAPLILLAIAPDTLAWSDLAPLLASRSGSVHAVVLLGADSDHQAARAACHQVGVVEVGGPAAAPLPESFRPAGLAAPRDRSALAWHTHRSTWRGTPLDTAGDIVPNVQEVSP